MNTDIYCEQNSQNKGARLPSLAALRCFEAAAGTESFSRAAERLNLTHGAISRAVRLLEDELGVALFERRGRRVFLTDAGRKLAEAVRQGFGMIAATARELRESGKSRPLTISCEPTLLMRWLIPRLPQFQALHPDVSVQLVAGGGPVGFEGGIDLAIRRNDFDWPAHYHAVRLFDERTGPVCRADRIAEFIRQDDDGVAHLRPDATRLHSRTRPEAWASWWRGMGEDSDEAPGQVFEHFYFSLQAATAGIGVAIGPWPLVCDDIDGGILAAPFGFRTDGSGYYLLAPKAFGQSSSQGYFQRWLHSLV
ncbi:LysR family transcriptional regulator [Zobellella iuensis]|uniref:LysR family transcriptional regulator n=1 Tax=Zobellella iuensis TaxID=2803811 RepID=UPI001F01D5B6|nr:LysR family transcriptional regulator [Zobellella iuensis]